MITDSDCSVNTQETMSLENSFIYPNPVTDFLHVDTQNKIISLSDIYGRQLFSNYFTSVSNLDLSYLSSGTYILTIGKETYKLIKK